MTGLDLSRERVENLKDFLFEALIGDATDRATLVPLSLDKCEAVLISLGGSIVPSLLATLHAKEQGARRIIVKGLDSDHGLLLKQLDVERVIYPKIDAGNHLADQLTWPSILDSLRSITTTPLWKWLCRRAGVVSHSCSSTCGGSTASG